MSVKAQRLVGWVLTLLVGLFMIGASLDDCEQEICQLLATEIDRGLPKAESKVWHAHPVWFLDGNPIVGYSQQKLGIRLMFWSGADFQQPGLDVVGKKFKDASIFFNDLTEIKKTILRRWPEGIQTYPVGLQEHRQAKR